MKSVLLYLVLVGTPFLGLLGILQIGEKLEAPVSVGGSWAVESTTAQALERSCAPLEAPGDRLELTISQSGRYVQLRLNDAAKTSMTGRLHARTLTARRVLASGAHARNDCGATTEAELQLEVHHRSGGADRLSGSWRVPGCDACPTQSFRAVRLTDE